MKMRGKPDLTDFIEGADAKEKGAATQRPKAKTLATQYRQKGLRLPTPMLTALRMRAIQESEAQGRRVTEQEIIIAALQSYLAL